MPSSPRDTAPWISRAASVAIFSITASSTLICPLTPVVVTSATVEWRPAAGPAATGAPSGITGRGPLTDCPRGGGTCPGPGAGAAAPGGKKDIAGGSARPPPPVPLGEYGVLSGSVTGVGSARR